MRCRARLSSAAPSAHDKPRDPTRTFTRALVQHKLSRPQVKAHQILSRTRIAPTKTLGGLTSRKPGELLTSYSTNGVRTAWRGRRFLTIQTTLRPHGFDIRADSKNSA